MADGFCFNIRSRDGSVGITLGYGLDDRGLEPRQGLGIFLFTTVSRPPLRPTQPHVQWVPWAIPLGVKRPERETDHSSPSSAEVKNACSYIATPAICLHAVVLSLKKSTGTTFPFTFYIPKDE
jgi:hypothetical protein